MADRYWVGGSGTWDATTTTNWATSSGGAGGASAPTSSDNVIFDAGSNVGTSAFTVTVAGTSSAPSACNDFTAGSLDGAMTLTLGSTAVLDCYGSMTLPASNLTISGTLNAILNFKATTTGKIITTNGVGLSAVYVIFDGVGGGWTLGSAFTSVNNIGIVNGTFNTGNFNVTVATIQSSNTNTRTITLGSSTLTLSGSAPITFTTSTNLTLNANTSQITCSGASPTFAGGGLTFYNVSFTSAATGTVTITGTNTFNNFTQTSRSTSGAKVIVLYANQTVSGTLTLGAANTATRRVQVYSDITGTQRTITLNGTLATLADCDFRDIATAGTAGTWTGTRIGNGLNNSGITFDAPKTVYWNFAAGGTWVTTAWATSSGGTPAVNNFPLAQDKVIIEDTGLNSGASIGLSGGNFWIGELDISTRTLPMTLASSTLSGVVYKNMTLTSAVTMTGTIAWQFVGQGTTQILNVQGAVFTPPITVDIPSGTLQLAENTICSATVTLTSGTLDLNNNVLTANAFNSSNSNTRVIAFGTGNITLTGNAATIWTVNIATNFSYTGTPTLNATYSGSTGTRSFFHAGSTGGTESNSVNLNVTAGTDTFTIGTAANIKNLNFTGFAGILSNGTRNIYGNLTFSSGMTCIAGANTTTFTGTSGTQLITTNGVTLDFPITQNGVGGTVQLQDNLTLGSTRTYTFTAGTLDLTGNSGNWALNTGNWSSVNSNTRAILFGTGSLNVANNATTIFSMSTATGFTYTGTPTVNLTYAGSTGTRTVTFGSTGGTELNALNFNVSAGTDSVVFSARPKNINFTGFSGTLAASAITMYGNLTISTGMTLAATSSVLTFSATSGTQQITTNGKTLDFPLTFNGVGGLFAFQDALTMGGTRTLTLSAGTLLLKSGTTNTVGTVVLSGNNSSNTKLGATTPGFQAFLQKVIGGTINATNITVQDSFVTPTDTWYGDYTVVDAGNNQNWIFEQTSIQGHDAFLPQEIRHFKDLDKKAKAAEAARIRAVKLMAYHRKRKFKELLAPELINPNEESFYEQLREEQFPEQVAKEKAEKVKTEEKAKVEAKKLEIKKELKRLKKEQKEAEEKLAQLQREKELLIDSVIQRQEAIKIQAQLAIINKLRQEEMDDEAALLLLI